jgi:3-methyladenine DNA glycosylase AlkD
MHKQTYSFATQAHNLLSPARNPQHAQAMRAYMKDHFPFLGIAAPLRRAICRPLLQELGRPDAATCLAIASELWAQDEREFHYLALDLLARNVRRLSHADIPALLQLARQKSWWDSVDGLVGVIGDILLSEKKQGQPDVHALMDDALTSDDFWLRRIALLHQLGWREQLDWPRLSAYCLQLAAEEEFFIRKAIGWALRDYARHTPQQVATFLQQHRAQLSPLSYREAAKHL